VIDLASGEILHSLDLPEPIDELFDVAVLPGVRQPRALGLQGEEIDCLVKIPERPELLHVRPMAPSGKPHQGPSLRHFGLPEPSAAETPIHYQRVFHLTPANLSPYAALTFPTLAPGSNALSRIQGELLGLSAMASGVMVGFAIAERRADGGAQLLSLKVDPAWRRRGIGTGLLQRLMVFLAKEQIAPLSLRYKANAEISACFEAILARLGWSQPRTDCALLEGRSDKLAAIDWADRFPITSPYSLLPWEALTDEQPPADPRGLEPSICLAHRTSATNVRYSSLFVTPAHRGRARALALLTEAFHRQHAAGLGGDQRIRGIDRIGNRELTAGHPQTPGPAVAGDHHIGFGAGFNRLHQPREVDWRDCQPNRKPCSTSLTRLTRPDYVLRSTLRQCSGGEDPSFGPAGQGRRRRAHRAVSPWQTHRPAGALGSQPAPAARLPAGKGG
jgi:ribosomal protein S18 acetylase RimI-like enzyme